MTQKLVPSPPHFRSAKALLDHIAKKKLGTLNPKDWQEQWADRWVVYADLIAFAARSLRSEQVVLNNIVRFDRASKLVSEQLPQVAVRRFSDATFAVADTFGDALAFGVALSHACLAFNRHHLGTSKKPFFIHLIVPRVTMARGRVLLLPPTAKPDPRFGGIEPSNVLAGSAIVKAYQLERLSAGGLLTVDQDGITQLRQMKVRGDDTRVTRGVRSWTGRLSDKTALAKGEVFFCRQGVCDIPWLLLRPLQDDVGSIWCSTMKEADEAVRSHMAVWDTSVREFYSPQNQDTPLDVSKHAQAAIRHGVQCWHASHGRSKPAYGPPSLA